MLRLLLFLFVAPFVVSCDSGDSEDNDPIDDTIIPGWTLVWNDEFGGSAIDATKWSHQVTGNPANNELQYYTDRVLNSRTKDGSLVIEAHAESYTGPDGTREYTSARLHSQNKGDWKYGRFEIRAKLPKGQGMWPAIWMMPTDSEYGGWAASGEIDIMELLGHEPKRVYGTLHYGASYPNNTQSGTSTTLPSGSFADSFHVFSIIWDEGRIQWLVDGTPYATQTSWSTNGHDFPAPFDKKFYMILNVAVGGDWPGSPDETTLFPSRMEVDYVRVYEKE
ncbi:family 16 glycosylhydrolase [Bacteroidota bacterium]